MSLRSRAAPCSASRCRLSGSQLRVHSFFISGWLLALARTARGRPSRYLQWTGSSPLPRANGVHLGSYIPLVQAARVRYGASPLELPKTNGCGKILRVPSRNIYSAPRQCRRMQPVISMCTWNSRELSSLKNDIRQLQSNRFACGRPLHLPWEYSGSTPRSTFICCERSPARNWEYGCHTQCTCSGIY